VAERITAASVPQRAEGARSSDNDRDSPATTPRPAADQGEPATSGEYPPAGRAPAAGDPLNELHSGHKLAKRYRLEECVTRLDGFISWRAVDEKLRRAVGVHLLPADHARASSVLDAARAAALLGDPRFVQVLDADRHGELIHVIHEWLPDAIPLSTLLQSGPLAAHDARDLVSHVAQGMAAAHRDGLAHLRLTPGAVLRTGAGPFRIRGLAVDAALRGIVHEQPQRADTEATGALLYAALTQRWPYQDGGYGLVGVAGLGRGGSRDGLATPEQVRAGVHRGLSDLAMRALINDGATAASERPPCVTAEDVVKALAALPRIRPPETGSELLAGFQHTTYQQGSYGPGARPPARHTTVAATAPPTLPGRTGAALKWGVSALLIAALGLGSWQIADTLMGNDSPPPADTPTLPTTPDDDDASPSETPLTVVDIKDFDPYGSTGSQNPAAAAQAIDGDPETFWHTKNYYGPGFGNLKPGLGLILDLGETQEVGSVIVEALGEHSIQLLTADSSSAMPTSFDDFRLIDEATGEQLTLGAEEAVESRYLLVWLTELPLGDDGNYRGRIGNITVSS
jgi:hypothetical protein